jgi:hypothetical protein
MLRSIRRPVLALAAALALAGGCDSGDTPTDPSDPTPSPTVTESFSGSLTVNGGQTFNFAASAAGPVTATLSATNPDTAVVGLALGTWNGISCQIVLANDNASRGISVVGEASTFGNLCVRVYDTGQLTEPAAFLITVVHP